MYIAIHKDYQHLLLARFAKDSEVLATLPKNYKNPNAIVPKYFDPSIATFSITGLLTPQEFSSTPEPQHGYYPNETTYESLQDFLISAENDSKVKEIALFMDSPGGYVKGLATTFDILNTLTKPTKTIITDMAASAAYMLATQTDKILVAHTLATVGSVGVATTITNIDGMLARWGIIQRDFSNSASPLKRPDYMTDEGQSQLVAELDDLYNTIEVYMSKGRKTAVRDIREKYGKGAMLVAAKALEVGMIDGFFDKKTLTNSKNQVNIGVAQVAMGKTSEKGRITMELEQNNVKDFKSLVELTAAYPSFVKDAEDAAVAKERARVADWLAYATVDVAAVAQGISSGKKITLAEATNYAVRMNTKEDSLADNVPPVASLENNTSAVGNPEETLANTALKEKLLSQVQSTVRQIRGS